MDQDEPVQQTPNESRRGSRGGKPKLFQCTGYGDCRMVFTRSEHLARHMRYIYLNRFLKRGNRMLDFDSYIMHITESTLVKSHSSVLYLVVNACLVALTT